MQAELSPAPSCGRLFDMSAISMLYRDELMRCVPYGVTDCAVLSSDSAVSALINDCMRTSSNGRALTLRINRRGTSLSAYTEETGVVPFVKLIALCGMYELESGRDISVPYDAPAFLDELARSYGRTAYRYLSAPSDGSDNVARRLAARQFWSRDALFTAAKLACILEEKNMTFPELYSLLPPFLFTAPLRHSPCRPTTSTSLRAKAFRSGATELTALCSWRSAERRIFRRSGTDGFD